jgi:hypothetical protein
VKPVKPAGEVRRFRLERRPAAGARILPDAASNRRAIPQSLENWRGVGIILMVQTASQQRLFGAHRRGSGVEEDNAVVVHDRTICSTAAMAARI